MLMVLPIDDPLKARQVLEESAVLPQDATKREHNGVEIQEFTSKDATSYAAAVLGTDYILLTTSPTWMNKAIDTYRGEAAIANLPGYRSAFTQLQNPNAIAKIYINVPAASSAAAEDADQPIPPESLSTLQQNQGLATSVVLKSDGVEFEGITWLAPDSDRTYEVTNTAGQMPSLLPSETIGMVSGGNLQQLWQDYADNAAAQPLTPFHPDNVRAGFQSTTGLDLDEDLMPWMNGEFALSLFPISPAEDSADPGAPGSNIAAVMLVQTRDRNQAEQTLDQLDEVLSSRYRFQIEAGEIANQPVVNWVSPFGALTLSRGWVNEDTVFLALSQPAAQQILSPAANLAENQRFRSLTAESPQPNNGHFYINLEELLASETVPLPPLPPESEAVARSIQALGVTATILDPRTIRYDIGVMLTKGERPGDLPAPQPPDAEAAPDAAPDADTDTPTDAEASQEDAEDSPE
jgi:hypothetical protein